MRPWAILIDDRSDGMQLFYDRMTSFLALGNKEGALRYLP